MTPLEVAARFAAFVWYMNNRETANAIKQAEAQQFSKKNWEVFLPVAHEGWGRLLLRIAKAKKTRQRRARLSASRERLCEVG